jgi:hypothetical protein
VVVVPRSTFIGRFNDHEESQEEQQQQHLGWHFSFNFYVTENSQKNATGTIERNKK